MVQPNDKTLSASYTAMAAESLRGGCPEVTISLCADALQLDPGNKRAAAMIQIAEAFKSHPEYNTDNATRRQPGDAARSAKEARAGVPVPLTSPYAAAGALLKLHVQATGEDHFHHVLAMAACEQALAAMAERRFRDAHVLLNHINDSAWLLTLRYSRKECRRMWRSMLPPVSRGQLACSVADAADKISTLIRLLAERVAQRRYHVAWSLASDLVSSIEYLFDPGDRQDRHRIPG